MSGPDDGRPGAGTPDTASVPPAPPTFDQPAAPPSGGSPVQGPPSSPWWSTVSAPADGDAEPPGVLVAGPGVPSVDTRRAVPPSLRAPESADPTVTVRDDASSGRRAASPAAQTVTDLHAAGSREQTEQRLAASPGLWTSPSGERDLGQTVVDLASRPSEQPPAESHSRALAPLPPPQEPRKKRTALYVALALVPALAVAGAAYVVLGGSDAEKRPPQSPMAAIPSAPPSAEETPASAPETPPAKPSPPNVDNAKTDPKPLSVREIFPSKRIRLDGREFVLDRKSLNLRCDYAANGAMARMLVKQKCQGLVRSTYVTGDGRIGVTVGVVAMPTKKIALAIQRNGTPARKGNWFTALPGKRSKAVTRTGGHTALNTYGRYILYAYAQYLDDTKPAKQPKPLSDTTAAFLAYVNEPLKKR